MPTIIFLHSKLFAWLEGDMLDYISWWFDFGNYMQNG